MFIIAMTLCTMFATPAGPQIGCWEQTLTGVPAKTRQECLDHAFALEGKLAEDGIISMYEPRCVKLEEA